MQEFVLNAGQDIKGGMRDKPDKSVDFYHTCYCLSGFSAVQYDYTIENKECIAVERMDILGGQENRIVDLINLESDSSSP